MKLPRMSNDPARRPWPSPTLPLYVGCTVGIIALVSVTGTAYLREKKLRACRIEPTLKYCASAQGVREPPREINILAGLVPPDMNEDRTGREADIIVAALTAGAGRVATIGPKQIRFFVEPFARHWHSFETDPRFDAVATVPDVVRLRGYRSQFYIMYRNGIGSIAAAGQQPIRTADQLRDRRVISFAGAAQVIPELAKLGDNHFAVFLEREDQRIHSKLLELRKVDAVIADAMIFSWFNRGFFDTGPRPSFRADGFTPTCYRMVFRNADYRDLFDDGLAKLIAAGRLREIDAEYTNAEIKGWGVEYVGAEGRPRCETN